MTCYFKSRERNQLFLQRKSCFINVNFRFTFFSAMFVTLLHIVHKLCKSSANILFSCARSKQANWIRQDGPMLPAPIANQNIVSTSYCSQALPVV